jgi:hypothetical protein
MASNRSPNTGAPLAEPTKRPYTFQGGGAVNKIDLLADSTTGGFLILWVDASVNPGTSWHVAIFVGVHAAPFSWGLPDYDNDPSHWAIVDVPRGFSINNGERLWKTMGGKEPEMVNPYTGIPTIVHGHP